MKLSLRISATLTMASVALTSFACAPSGGGGPGALVVPGGSPGGIVTQGTVSGGGGNGCDGKAFEAYAKNITTLDEYKLFIRPLLRRMSEESADPLVTYMIWAAEEKAWYFAPCELDKLSSAQVGVDGDSDQLARHREHGIQIYAIEDSKNVKNAKTYFQKKMKAKAALLLHEMVMGARLLMKKSAKDQCTVLAKKDAKMCSDPELMAIAESREIAPDKVDVMDANDHEAVRKMTALIAQKDADLSTENLKAMRERLGFHFPWDRAQSTLTYDGVRDAFARTQQLGDTFRVTGSAAAVFANGGRTYIKPTEHPYFKDIPVSCSVAVQNDSWMYFNMLFVTPLNLNGSHNETQKVLEKVDAEHRGSVCEPNVGRVHQPYVYDKVKNQFTSVECKPEQQRLSLYDYRAQFGLDKEGFTARGVIRNGVLYDEVSKTITNSFPWLTFGKTRQFAAGIVRVLITREDAPRIRSISFEPKQVLDRKLRHDVKDTGPVELLPVPNTPILECANESLIRH